MHYDKKSLRQTCLEKRNAISADDARVASEKIAQTLLSILPQNAIVSGYRAVNGEIDISQALMHLAARGATLCLPVVQDKNAPLLFRKWQVGQPLEKGAYGIDVPPANAAIVSPDLLLVPLLAFDAAGHRLGYGAGYYDRTIAGLRAQKKVQIVGIAFSIQQLEHIPAEPHDAKLDAVITEKTVLRFT